MHSVGQEAAQEPWSKQPVVAHLNAFGGSLDPCHLASAAFLSER